MALGRKTGGRQKGGLNRFTVSAKEAFQVAFEGSGGSAALTAWANENRTDFYKLFSKLIPAEVVGPGEHGEHKIDISLTFS